MLLRWLRLPVVGEGSGVRVGDLVRTRKARVGQRAEAVLEVGFAATLAGEPDDLMRGQALLRQDPAPLRSEWDASETRS